MGKHKSLSAKRRQGQQQKRLKVERRENNACNSGSGAEHAQALNPIDYLSESTFGSPGSPSDYRSPTSSVTEKSVTNTDAVIVEHTFDTT